MERSDRYCVLSSYDASRLWVLKEVGTLMLSMFFLARHFGDPLYLESLGYIYGDNLTPSPHANS